MKRKGIIAVLVVIAAVALFFILNNNQTPATNEVQDEAQDEQVKEPNEENNISDDNDKKEPTIEVAKKVIDSWGELDEDVTIDQLTEDVKLIEEAKASVPEKERDTIFTEEELQLIEKASEKIKVHNNEKVEEDSKEERDMSISNVTATKKGVNSLSELLGTFDYKVSGTVEANQDSYSKVMIEFQGEDGASEPQYVDVADGKFVFEIAAEEMFGTFTSVKIGLVDENQALLTESQSFEITE